MKYSNSKVHRLASLVRFLEESLNALSVTMLVMYFILVLLQIFFRFVINESLFWAEELVRGLMIWGVMIASVLVGRARGHIRVEALELMVDPNARRYVYQLCDLLSIIFCVLLAVASVQLMSRVWNQMTPILEIPKWTVYMALCVGPVLEALIIVLTWGQTSEDVSKPGDSL